MALHQAIPNTLGEVEFRRAHSPLLSGGVVHFAPPMSGFFERLFQSDRGFDSQADYFA